VTIDATSALVRSAGIKSYTYHWLRHLRRQANAADIIRAFPAIGDWNTLEHSRSALPAWTTFRGLALLHSVNVTGSGLLDQVLRGVDIFHSSNQVRHAPRKTRLTATVHDLTCWLMPELHTAANVQADRNFADRILRQAHGLIAVSENTRQDAIRLLGIAPDKIRTIYSGVSEEYFNARPTPRPRPYVLIVGSIEPRKNIATLLDAWALLKPSLRAEFDLVIAGPPGWKSEALMARIQSEATYLGYVPQSDLPGLMAGASVFVYPSLYEGFGLPVVEAMAAGAPVLTSNTSSLPEIAGEAAVLADPRSASAIAQGLTQLLESEAERSRRSECGRTRAQRFHWETCAAETLEFFENVLGR
jgi:glycosyltransferase involved in cell wall biosynthesis